MSERKHIATREGGAAFVGRIRALWRTPLRVLLIAFLAALPVLVVASSLLTPSREVWVSLAQTLLPEMARNTLVLLLGVGLGTFVLGVGLAWLVTAYVFPGRNLLEWMLVLPMAVPTYVQAFVYMATFDFAGPVQSFLRSHFGTSEWFPEIRSGTGAIVVMVLVLYPYVYLLARAGFKEQSGAAIEAARVMGYRPFQVFLRVVLPLARPSVIAGVTLAIMEALADFATVRLFNFPTLADGVIRVWHGMMDVGAASELAGLLAFVALGIVLLERAARGRSRYFQTGGKAPGIVPVSLSGWKGALALAACLAILGVAFVLPVAQLASWGLREMAMAPAGTMAVYAELARNSLTLAGVAAVFAVATAVILMSGARQSGNKISLGLARLATVGYAIPGAVIAVGVIVPLSAFDHALNDMLEAWRGVSVGLVLTGSIAGLIYAYVVRFIAVGYNSVESSMEKITPNITAAARVLGAGPWRMLWRVHLPLIAPGLLTGAILVFVDVLKELPITLMLRPFGYDTLAVWVWQAAAESAWAGASLPALGIVLVGLVPVAIFVRLAARNE